MATFTNQATLSYNNTVTRSNIVTGELVDILTATKTAVTGTYGCDSCVAYAVSIVNSGASAFTGLTQMVDVLVHDKHALAVTLCQQRLGAGVVR